MGTQENTAGIKKVQPYQHVITSTNPDMSRKKFWKRIIEEKLKNNKNEYNKKKCNY